MQNILAEIARLDIALSMQPAAGAQGELDGLVSWPILTSATAARRSGRAFLIPDSACLHQSPLAAAIVEGRRRQHQERWPWFGGFLADLKSKLDGRAADIFMDQRTRTRLGPFDPQLAEITDLVHGQGRTQKNLDGANMNAILGVTRLGDFGVDMSVHYNGYKTFTGLYSTPMVRAAGPIGRWRVPLEPFGPALLVVQGDGGFRSPTNDRPGSTWAASAASSATPASSSGGWFYIRTLGPAGLRAVSENAARERRPPAQSGEGDDEVPHGDRCMHEFVGCCLPHSCARAQHQRDGER